MRSVVTEAITFFKIFIFLLKNVKRYYISNMILENNKSLLNHNTFMVNCFAEQFISVKKEQDIIDVIKILNKNKKKHFILGGGSNILFTKDISGVIIQNKLAGIKIIKEDELTATIRVGSGVIWNDFVKWSIERNLWGIENLILIPGTVGAAPIQNIGAYGVEIKDVFKNLKAYHLKTGEKKIFSKKDCLFGYRDSIFKNKLKNKFFISEIEVVLQKKDNPILTYENLKFEFKNKQKELTIKNISDVISEIRNRKLPDPNKLGNCGSFFKNPIINEEEFQVLKKKFPEIKYFKKNNKVKLSAGWLIEQCGWKGKKINDCGVYEKQALVLVNFGRASGSEIKSLAEKIKKDILNKFNVKLEEEVQII